MRRFTQTNPFSNYTPSVSSTPTYGESAMTAAPTNNTAQFSSDQLMGILQMLQNQRPAATPEVQQNYGDSLAKALGVVSIGMSGDKGNESYFLQNNGNPISLDQYNNARQAQAEAAAKRGGYNLLPAPSDQSKRSLGQYASLFYDGPRYAPEPMTQAGLNNWGSYLASTRNSPRSRAYAAKVSGLLQSGVPVGYGVIGKNGKVYTKDGKEVTGYGYVGGSLTPQYITADMAGGSSQSMGGNSSKRSPMMYTRSGNSPQMMRSPAQGMRNQGALSYASNVAPSRFAMPRISYAEGSQEPTITYSMNGQAMNVDQYNAMQRQKVIDMARKQGREVREPTRPGESRFSLFGPMVLPTPLTEAQFKARGQYAASRRGTPEQEAFNRKVSGLINNGVAIGYDNYSKGDGKVYNSQTGRQVTGYGSVGDYATPQFFLGNAVDLTHRNYRNAAASRGNARGGLSPNQAFVMTGKNNDTPMFKFGDSLMDADQYNDWKYRNAAAAAERQGRELLPRDPNKGPLSMAANLFGPMYEPEKLTPEQFRAKVEYANRPGRSSKTRLFPGTTPVSSLAYYEPAFAQNGRTFGQSKRGGASLFGRR